MFFAFLCISENFQSIETLFFFNFCERKALNTRKQDVSANMLRETVSVTLATAIFLFTTYDCSRHQHFWINDKTSNSKSENLKENLETKLDLNVLNLLFTRPINPQILDIILSSIYDGTDVKRSYSLHDKPLTLYKEICW